MLNVVLQVAMEGDDLNPHRYQDGEVKFAVHRQPVVLDFYWLVQNDVLLGSRTVTVPGSSLHSINAGDILYIHM